jgi:hypothetical protein
LLGAAVQKKTAAKTEADPYGMTTKKAKAITTTTKGDSKYGPSLVASS